MAYLRTLRPEEMISGDLGKKAVGCLPIPHRSVRQTERRQSALEPLLSGCIGAKRASLSTILAI
jgi:hypothetical protein